MNKTKNIIYAVAALFPFVALATSPSTFRELAELIVGLVKGFVAILFASFSVAMVYGVVVYLMNADNEQKRSQIKGYLLWGIIGITVAFGLWGILQIMCNTLGWGLCGIPIIEPPE
jgi:succinate dehydrogenase/fumarate reductase cytochrome b subunit